MFNEAKFKAIKSEVESAGATLVAVTKQRPVEVIEHMYALGHRDFGENRVSEITDKYEALPKDIRWHFIGHLQRNKVKNLASFVHLIHSGDSARLLREINKQAIRRERTVPVLLQYHIAKEEAKYGLDPTEPTAVLNDLALRDIGNVRIAGVMGMATYTQDESQMETEFSQLKGVYDTLKIEQFADSAYFREISMGMSGDYRVALRKGSTMVRVGSLLYT